MKTKRIYIIGVILFLGLSVSLKATVVVDLEWKTQSETNNDFFSIERSLDATSWETVASMKGNGTSTELHSYLYTDKNAPEGLIYYRLIQTDFDGKSVVSKIISVNNSEKSNMPNVIVFPNPSMSYICLKSNEDVFITGMFASNNKLVYNYTIAYDTILIGELQAGVYYIQYQTAKGEVKTIPFIKD
jgi:hypothetical protein